jgi:hypothetical protein
MIAEGLAFVVSLGSLGSDPIRERKGQSNGDILLTVC